MTAYCGKSMSLLTGGAMLVSTRSMNLSPFLMIVAAISVSACSGNEADSEPGATALNTEKMQDDNANGPVAASGNHEIADPESGKRLRPANYYHLEWGGDPELCPSALVTLNNPYTVTKEIAASGRAEENNYASRQAARMLGTENNVNWRPEDTTAGADAAALAEFDYFNDGTNRRIIRMNSRLSGYETIGLGVIETVATNPSLLSFGHAGANTQNLPPQDNLHTKLTYSVADVMRLQEGYHTIVAPLEDIDASGRAYLIRWRAKEGKTAPFDAGDYYPVIACMFRPNSAQQQPDK